VRMETPCGTHEVYRRPLLREGKLSQLWELWQK
jgi:hypothetical protein